MFYMCHEVSLQGGNHDMGNSYILGVPGAAFDGSEGCFLAPSVLGATTRISWS